MVREQLYVYLAGLASVGPIGSSAGTAGYLTHVGGFLFGLLAIRLLSARRATAAGPAGVLEPMAAHARATR